MWNSSISIKRRFSLHQARQQTDLPHLSHVIQPSVLTHLYQSGQKNEIFVFESRGGWNSLDWSYRVAHSVFTPSHILLYITKPCTSAYVLRGLWRKVLTAPLTLFSHTPNESTQKAIVASCIHLTREEHE